MLYEIEFQKYFYDTADRSGLRVYQVPAQSEWDACAKLGQDFSSQEYTLKILLVTKVR